MSLYTAKAKHNVVMSKHKQMCEYLPKNLVFVSLFVQMFLFCFQPMISVGTQSPANTIYAKCIAALG